MEPVRGDASSPAELDQKAALHTALDLYVKVLEDLKTHGLLEKLQRLEENEASEFFDLLKQRVESTSFLEKLCDRNLGDKGLGRCNLNFQDHSSWLLVDEIDTFKPENDDEGYVLVTHEDIVDGITCFMAKYLSSVSKAKELSPQDIQKAVTKALGTLRNKGKLKRLWSYGKTLYTAASWSATAVGLYHNPPISRAALMYMWTTICLLIESMK